MQYLYLMTRKDYRNVSVPVAIHDAIDEIVHEKGSLYRTVSELVMEALREKIITIRSQSILPGQRNERMGKHGGKRQ